jgi:hypothetical protein
MTQLTAIGPTAASRRRQLWVVNNVECIVVYSPKEFPIKLGGRFGIGLMSKCRVRKPVRGFLAASVGGKTCDAGRNWSIK